jgi:hypothetical protein
MSQNHRRDASAIRRKNRHCSRCPFSKIRKDFDAAGVVQSDEDILRVMNELMLKAAKQMEATRGSVLDAAAVTLARNLTSR